MAKRKLVARLNGKRDSFLKSFSLIEVFVAMVIFVTLINTAILLFTRSLATVNLILEKLIAAELAQEGVEIVRNIKDSNVISGAPWDSGLVPGTYYADYNDLALIPSSSPPPLKQDANGFFNYENGTSTPFIRKIEIQKIDDHHLKVNSIVSWTHKGQSFSVNVESHLYEY